MHPEDFAQSRPSKHCAGLTLRVTAESIRLRCTAVRAEVLAAKVRAVLALVLLAGLLLIAVAGLHAPALFEAPYRAGGAGVRRQHVLLPLLDTSFVSGWISASPFLSGLGGGGALSATKRRGAAAR